MATKNGMSPSTHVWCESNDVLMADRAVVALHTLKPGLRTLRLPRQCDVVDVVADRPFATSADSITWTAPAGPDTRAFHLRLMPVPAPVFREGDPSA
jgi:hypothetical protein